MVQDTVKITIKSDIKELNDKINKINNNKNWYKIEYTDKSKTLKYSKNVLNILNSNGLNYDKTYIPFKYKSVFNSIYTILKDNSDIFTDITDITDK